MNTSPGIKPFVPKCQGWGKVSCDEPFTTVGEEPDDFREVTAPLVRWLGKKPAAVRDLIGAFLGNNFGAEGVPERRLPPVLGVSGPLADPGRARLGESSAREWARKWRIEDAISSGRLEMAMDAAFGVVVALVTTQLLRSLRVRGVPQDSTAIAQAILEACGCPKPANTPSPPAAGPSPLASFYGWLGLEEVIQRGNCPEEIGPIIERLADHVGTLLEEAVGRPDAPSDFFRGLHEAFFPKQVRLARGEFYTPLWLARMMVEMVDYPGGTGGRLFDPACGSGVFLVAAAWQRAGRPISEGFACPSGKPPEGDGRPEDPLEWFLGGDIVGLDIEPAAVLTARANLVLAAVVLRGKIRPASGIALSDLTRYSPPVERGDLFALWAESAGGGKLRRTAEECTRQGGWLFRDGFQFLVGNPPWLIWDRLSEEDRRRLLPVFQELGLFDLSPQAARHGGAKRDYGAAFLWAASEFLAPGGRLAMLVPVTLFRSASAGQSFRRLLVERRPPLGVLRVEDLHHLSLFPGTIRRTAILVAEKGTATTFPVPVRMWQALQRIGGFRDRAILPEGTVKRRPLLMEPLNLGEPQGPWAVMSEPLREVFRRVAGHSDYRAYLGANTGGANGVFWLEILGWDNGKVIVRNLGSAGRTELPCVTTTLEPDLLYPLLRWKDLPHPNLPGLCILLVQNPTTRRPWGEEELRDRWPLTYAYLSGFRDLLERRAIRKKLQTRAVWYAQYNVGPYTLAPHKVVWQRMGLRWNAIVVEEKSIGGLPARPVVPQETCCFIPADSCEEAIYLAAVLNSPLLERLIAAVGLAGSRSFGTPSILEALGIPRFRPADPRCRALVHFYRDRGRRGLAPNDQEIRYWTDCVARLYDLDPELVRKAIED